MFYSGVNGKYLCIDISSESIIGCLREMLLYLTIDSQNEDIIKKIDKLIHDLREVIILIHLESAENKFYLNGVLNDTYKPTYYKMIDGLAKDEDDILILFPYIYKLDSKGEKIVYRNGLAKTLG